ncbi:unnamed protein product, partial [Schistosoma intercalatum]
MHSGSISTHGIERRTLRYQLIELWRCSWFGNCHKFDTNAGNSFVSYSYCAAKGLQICGYFQANEYINCNTPTSIACRIGEKLAEKCGNVCLLTFKNDALHRLTGNYFTVFCKSDWKWNDTKYTFNPNVNKKLKEILHLKVHRQIVDFDDHL